MSTQFLAPILLCHSKTWTLALFSLTKPEQELFRLKIKDFLSSIIVSLTTATNSLGSNFWQICVQIDKQS